MKRSFLLQRLNHTVDPSYTSRCHLKMFSQFLYTIEKYYWKKSVNSSWDLGHVVLLAQSSESLLLRKYKVFVHSQEMSYIYSKADRKTGTFLSLNGLNYFVVIGMANSYSYSYSYRSICVRPTSRIDASPPLVQSLNWTWLLSLWEHLQWNHLT